jgi:hypothetical protein
MGLGIHMLADLQHRGLIRRVRPAKAIQPLAEQLRELAVRMFPQLAPYTLVEPGDEGEILLRLHPADEEVRLSAHGDRVLLSARTNGAGPGYHAFLVSLMDAVAAEGTVKWLPTFQEGEGDGADEYNDETGYFASRDFVALKGEMAGWLAAVSAQMIEEAVDDNLFLVSMPMGTPMPVGFRGALAPMGRFSEEWLGETADAEGGELLARAAKFFPWWEQGVHDQARVGVGQTALWRFPWHPPRGGEETALAEVALACLGAAASGVGSGTPVSRRDVEELAALMAVAPEDARPPSANGFGCMRGDVRWTPFPGCSIALPGYVYSEQDEDGSAQTYWFGNRVVRIVSWLVSGGERSDPRGLVEVTTAKPDGPATTSSFEIDAPPLKGYCALLAAAPGDDLRHAHAVIERPGRMLLLTITFESDADAPWVEEVVRSITVLPTEGH